MMPVKGCCLVTLGVHHQDEGRDFGTRGAVKGISQQSGTQALPLEVLIDGQTTHAYRGHGRITRQFLRSFGR